MQRSLEEYLKEAEQRDDIGGYHSDESRRKWPPGSCWESEGRFLYANVRMLRPRTIVEIGRWEGCSTSHLALACKHNDFGTVYSIDIAARNTDRIPKDLLPRIVFVDADALTCPIPPDIEFLLEDGAHTTGFTAAILRRYPVPEGIIVVHDYCHWDCQETTKAECDEVLGAPPEIFQTDSDCGYAVYRQ